MSTFRRGKYGYKSFTRASKFRRTMRGRRMGKAPISRAAYRVNGRGYHPFGQVGRPYSSVPQDYKMVDQAQAATAIPGGASGTGAGLQVFLNGVVVGAGFYNRVGRQICMKSLELMYEFSPTNSNVAAQPDLRTRILIYYDRQPNNAAPTIAQVLTTYNSHGTAFSNVWSFSNPTMKDRFVILRDIRLVLPPIGANGVLVTDSPFQRLVNNEHSKGADQINAMSGSIFLPLKDLMSTYSASTDPAVIGDCTTGALFVHYVTEDSSAATPAWQVRTSARLRYIDC